MNQVPTSVQERVMPDGVWEGTSITRVPAAHLRWIVRTEHQLAGWAKEELARRGTVVPDVDITAHAIDRVSTKALDIYRRECREGEGLHSWIARMANAALATAPIEKDHYLHAGIEWIFDDSGALPVLMTVTREQGA